MNEEGIERGVSAGERPEGEGKIERGTVRTNGIETYYERRGDGPPVVFVHGAIMDHSMWGPQVESLSEAFTTVSYDVRGHGRTGGSAVESYSIDLLAKDLASLITALDLQQPVLCGLSMGGCIAQVYAARHPERISGLVLADTWTPDLSTLGERLQMAALRATILPVRLVGYPRVQRVKNWVHERFDRGASGDYEEIERLQTAMPTMATAEFAKVIRATAGFRGIEVDLAAITVPTLVLYGENELAFVRRQAGLLGERIPNASVRAVPGAGHASNLDNPEFFTGAVRELLGRTVG